MMPYEKFEAWQACHQLALEIYRITDRWPTTERYQLTARTRRVALCAPTNIAEGASKRDQKEFRRYLDTGIALRAFLPTVIQQRLWDSGRRDVRQGRCLEASRGQNHPGALRVPFSDPAFLTLSPPRSEGPSVRRPSRFSVRPSACPTASPALSSLNFKAARYSFTRRFI